MNNIDRKKIDMDKIRNYPTVNESLNAEYGIVGSASREKFSEQSQAYFTGQIIEDARKKSTSYPRRTCETRWLKQILYFSYREWKNRTKGIYILPYCWSARSFVDLNPIHS